LKELKKAEGAHGEFARLLENKAISVIQERGEVKKFNEGR
jgi:hypothetical protein